MTRAFVILVIFLLLAPAAQSQQTTSHYVASFDGTKLAVDVNLPETMDGPLPTLLILTRYWRANENPQTGEPNPNIPRIHRFFLENGYAIVTADVRGSGASYGRRPAEYSPTEVKDAYSIVDWIVDQEWADGNLGSFGTSYTGTTAELLAAINHPAVKAVIPGWSDYDTYVSPVRPYGMLASSFMKTWSDLVHAMDNNNTAFMGASVKRVDADEDGKMLAEALEDHKSNPTVFEHTTTAEYRDSKMGDFTYDECSPLYWKDEIERSGVPMLVLVSWMDAGTADGALKRFQHFSNPQKLFVLCSTHGGGNLASPYQVDDSALPIEPSLPEQAQMRLDFFDYYLKGKDTGVEDWPAIRYYNLGEEGYRESGSWPPPGIQKETLYLTENATLTTEMPNVTVGQDQYVVDFTTTTGTNNRWMAQMGQPVLHLQDRSTMDDKMLIYTSEPLEQDMQITGTPVVDLHLSSTHEQGAIFVYLEDVHDGKSIYFTEGGLDLKHRKISPHPKYEEEAYHSFLRRDAAPMIPGQIEKVSIAMWPVSVLIKRGHRIRLAIAGADIDTFDRIPASGTPTYTVQRNAGHKSSITLPVLPR